MMNSAEFIEALKLMQRESLSADKLRGSWAGAMGQVQFIPTTFTQHAVDGDADGRRDIWTSLPDAFSSAAFPGMEEQVKQNMAIFQKTMQMFNPFAHGAPSSSEESAGVQQSETEKAGDSERTEELQTLRDQLQTMQAQINKLAEGSK